MKLYVNEKLFSLHDKFYIMNEAGQNILELSSKVFSIGRKTWLKDLEGKELAYMAEEVLHLMPHYNIFVNGELKCKIVKKFKFFKNDYELSNGYRVDGDFFGLDFSVYDSSNNVAGTVKRKFFTIGDKYEIEIFDEKDYILILAIIMAITNDINNQQSDNGLSFND